MLAKEIKIKTLRKQREYIKKQLSQIHLHEDGDSSYRYIGHLYPETIKYFESEGFVVTKMESDMITALAKGMPIYLFVIGDVDLTDAELARAEAYINDDETPGHNYAPVEELILNLFG